MRPYDQKAFPSRRETKTAYSPGIEVHSAFRRDAQPIAQPDRLQAALAGSLRAAHSGGRLPQTLGVSYGAAPALTLVYPLMIAIAAFCVSLVALIFSGIALVITYRKEAHRIRLELSPAKYGGVVLGINNDSGIDTSVRSIGYFRYFGEVTWLTDTVGDHVINKTVEFPFVVKARSTFEAYLNTMQKIPNFSKVVGLCVQLDTGRLYVLPQRIAPSDSIRMHLVSWVSRVTGGRYAPGVKRPRVKVYQ